MDILFCTHCGFTSSSDVFVGALCPKCSCAVIRNLSTELYCGDCFHFHLERDKKDNRYTGAFVCRSWDMKIHPWQPATRCSTFQEKPDRALVVQQRG